jgi:hypothetical protein
LEYFLRKLKHVFWGLVVALLVALPVGSYLMYLKFYQPHREAGLDELRKISTPMLSDLKLLDETQLIAPISFNSNADVLLSQHVSWQGMEADVLSDENHKMLIQFRERHIGWDKSPEKLTSMLNDPDLDRIDTSWLSQLENYDHWNVLDNSHIKPHLERAKKMDAIARVGLFASLPIPSYYELQSWAAVYFMQMHKKNKSIEGLKIYRKTAQLVYSSSLLVASMMTVKLFDTERYLVDTLKIKNWSTPNREATAALKRVSWGWVGVLKKSFSTEMSSDFEKYVKVENGICSAPFEVAMVDAIALDYLSPNFIFESDHTADIERLSLAIENFRSKCHMSGLKVFSERTPASVNNWRPQVEASFVTNYNELGVISLLGYLNFSKIPYVRRMFGYLLSESPDAGYFKLYKSEKN